MASLQAEVGAAVKQLSALAASMDPAAGGAGTPASPVPAFGPASNLTPAPAPALAPGDEPETAAAARAVVAKLMRENEQLRARLRTSNQAGQIES